VTLSGSGTLEPADSYTVTSLISGDIISAPFEEGETVGKGQVLYDVYSSDIESSVKQAENNLKDSEHNLGIALRQLDSLKPKAGGSGSVVELNVEAGDAVQAGQTIALSATAIR
jgi:HlyD family secretion protein